MSHELRTPLNAIIGFSELLLEPPGVTGRDSETVGQYTDHIHKSGLHLLDLINDVLDLAKVEAGRLELRPARFDLRALVGQTAETMRPLADRKSISVDLPIVDAVEIEADPSRIRQVIYNLLSNAIKFTPEGGRVTIGLAVDDGFVRLSVADTGPGIGSDNLERVFEAFQQLKPSDASLQGTGLGLALARQLVERHGGRIELESEIGVGSRFSVLLPVAGTSEVAPASAGPAPVDEVAANLVLIIEDDPRAAELLRVYLTEARFSVVVAPDGRTGLARAAELRPAAIILDILLPDIHGWEVMQRLKRADGTRDIPVVVISVVDDAQLGLALGAVDYFVKPVARDSLLTALGRLTFTTKVLQRTVSVPVVDADAEAGGRYRTLLGPDGFAITSAESGEQGLELAAAMNPDLILLDLILPDLDGFEVVARLKSDPRTTAIPIWVTTRGGLSGTEKARLNGKVLAVADRGDTAMTALKHWLDLVATGARAAL